MTEPNPPDPKIIEQFEQMRRRRWIILAIGFVLLAVYFATLLRIKEVAAATGLSKMAVMVAVVLPLLVVMLAAFANWRCPACHKPLGRTFNPSFCPRCGAKLKE